MSKTEFTFKSSEGIDIVAYKHSPEKAPKAIVVIVHGMAEHAQRYDKFAEYLNSQNFVVYAHDQLGHGKTAGTVNKLGFFSENNGWQKVVDDLGTLVNLAKKENAGLKTFILGHSMGSFITRTYITEHSKDINGVILSGTAGSAGLLGKIGIGLTALISSFTGKRSLSPFLNSLSFGTFNNEFKPARTDFDWLSSVEANVDKYIADPFCGTVFSIGFFNNLTKALEFVNKPINAEKISKELPIYLFSGGKDPVSKDAAQIPTVAQMYKNVGIKDVSTKIYPEGRHEMLNEVNFEEVYSDVVEWINKIV